MKYLVWMLPCERVTVQRRGKGPHSPLQAIAVCLHSNILGFFLFIANLLLLFFDKS